MEKIIERYEDCQYSSLKYIDIEDIGDVMPENIIEKEGFLFMYNSFDDQIKIFWAANSREDFYDGLGRTLKSIGHPEEGIRRIYIGFIPPEFVEGMEQKGFKIVNEWVDYWIDDMFNVNISESIKHSVRALKKEECLRASDITGSCRGYSREFYGEDEEWVKEWIKSENAIILGVEAQGEIQGVCFLALYGFDDPRGTVLWLRELAVNPKYHSMGIGRSLVAGGLLWGKEAGAKRSFLAVDTENLNAIRLYESFGYIRKEEHGEIDMAFML